ncbi:hypothetical protein [Xanthomonas medicagonis]|uniref:hypothetical protein n=1 Tax=Xanthomonas medicagonis TaxID=3160841 RepID=UPI003514F846
MATDAYVAGKAAAHAPARPIAAKDQDAPMPMQDASRRDARHPRFACAQPRARHRPPPGLGVHCYRIWADAGECRHAVKQGWSWQVFALPYPPAPPASLPPALWLLPHAAAWVGLLQALGTVALAGLLLELAWRLPRAWRGHRWHERRLRAQGWRPCTRVLAIHAQAALLSAAIRSVAARRF